MSLSVAAEKPSQVFLGSAEILKTQNQQIINSSILSNQVSEMTKAM